MIIGIDLRPLQTGDKYRGVGEVVKQTTSRILSLAKEDKSNKVSFVFYEYDQSDDPKKLIDIPKGLDYEVCLQPAPPEDGEHSARRAKQDLRSMFGRSIKGANKCDVFLQFNYTLGVPAGPRTVLVKHDIIPYVFWDQYFSPTLQHVRNAKPRTAAKSFYKNFTFMQVLRRALKQADEIVTVSSHTKEDLQKHFGVKERKMQAVPLGVSLKPSKTHTKSKVNMPTKPYLLFLGGIDARRRAVDDIVAAFNNLKAQGHDIQLVLAGENFQAPTEIPVETVRNAVLKSSYKNDIITIGYIDDATKQTLFKGALAFVFPTHYEGFGIPVLEAMLMDCPVVAYKNSSIPEVGGEHVYYANNWQGIKGQVEVLLAQTKQDRAKSVSRAKAHAKEFTWDKTAQGIYQILTR